MRPRHDESRITFRRFDASDLPSMARWLADPDVAEWYRDGEPTVEAVTQQYGPMLAGLDPAVGWIIRIAGPGGRRDLGYIQAYQIADEAAYAAQLALTAPYRDGAVGIDLFLGDAGYRNGGWGWLVLVAFLRTVVFGAWGAPVAVIAPVPTNRRAIRAYQRAGFRWLKTVTIRPADARPTTGGNERSSAAVADGGSASVLERGESLGPSAGSAEGSGTETAAGLQAGSASLPGTASLAGEGSATGSGSGPTGEGDLEFVMVQLAETFAERFPAP